MGVLKRKTQKLSRDMFFLKLRAVLKCLLREQTVFHKRGQKHRLPDTFINNDYANVIKFMKITLNSTQNRQKTKKAQKDKKLVFQNNR